MTFTDTETSRDGERLTRQLLERIITESLPSEDATEDHMHELMENWPLPMYAVDIDPIPVTLDELKAQQDRLLWSEFGIPY